MVAAFRGLTLCCLSLSFKSHNEAGNEANNIQQWTLTPALGLPLYSTCIHKTVVDLLTVSVNYEATMYLAKETMGWLSSSMLSAKSIFTIFYFVSLVG